MIDITFPVRCRKTQKVADMLIIDNLNLTMVHCPFCEEEVPIFAIEESDAHHIVIAKLCSKIS